MRNQRCCRWSGGLGTLLLLCVCGCVGPMFGGHGGQGGAAADGGFAAQWQGGRPGLKVPGQNAPPGPQQPAPVQAAATNDQIGLMTQKLQVTEDDRKVLAARLQDLEKNLREKEQML